MAPLPRGFDAASSRSQRRWPIRVATDAAIVAVAVPMGLEIVCPPVGGLCTDDAEHIVPILAAWFLGARGAWPILRRWNAAMERWLDGLTGERPPAKPWSPPDEL